MESRSGKTPTFHGPGQVRCLARQYVAGLRVQSEQNLEQLVVLLVYDDIRPSGNGIGGKGQVRELESALGMFLQARRLCVGKSPRPGTGTRGISSWAPTAKVNRLCFFLSPGTAPGEREWGEVKR